MNTVPVVVELDLPCSIRRGQCVGAEDRMETQQQKA